MKASLPPCNLLKLSSRKSSLRVTYWNSMFDLERRGWQCCKFLQNLCLLRKCILTRVRCSSFREQFFDFGRYIEGLVSLPGEGHVLTVPSVQYFSPLNVLSAPAPLYLTNYQIVFFPADSISKHSVALSSRRTGQQMTQIDMATIRIPIYNIARLDSRTRSVRSGPSLKSIEIYCRGIMNYNI